MNDRPQPLHLTHSPSCRCYAVSGSFNLAVNDRRGPRPCIANDRLRYILIGYARVSKTDGSQSLDLQRDALRAEGIDDAVNLYHDFASGVRDDRPGLDSCVDFWALVIGLVAWIKFLDYLFGL